MEIQENYRELTPRQGNIGAFSSFQQYDFDALKEIAEVVCNDPRNIPRRLIEDNGEGVDPRGGSLGYFHWCCDEDMELIFSSAERDETLEDIKEMLDSREREERGASPEDHDMIGNDSPTASLHSLDFASNNNDIELDQSLSPADSEIRMLKQLLHEIKQQHAEFRAETEAKFARTDERIRDLERLDY